MGIYPIEIIGERVTFLFRCGNCGLEEDLLTLGKTILGYSFDNDIHRTKINYSLREESYECEFNSEDDYRSYESYYVTCPKCGHEEEWCFEYRSEYPFTYLKWKWRRRREQRSFFREVP